MHRYFDLLIYKYKLRLWAQELTSSENTFDFLAFNFRNFEISGNNGFFHRQNMKTKLAGFISGLNEYFYHIFEEK